MASHKKAVVIGAGIVGILTARELLEAGWHVTLVDAGHYFNGSSARSATGLRSQFVQPWNIVAMQYARDWYIQFAERHSVSPAFHPRGYLFLYTDMEAWTRAKMRVESEQALDYHTTKLLHGSENVQAQFPYVHAAELLGATWGPSDGFLEPDHVASTVLADLRKRFGAKFVEHYNSRVIDIYHNHGIDGVRLFGRSDPLTADLYINCTNAWHNQFRKLIYGDELREWPVMLQTLRRYLWFFTVPVGFDASKLPMIVLPNGTYLRPELSGKQLIMGHAHHVQPENGPPTAESQDQVHPEQSDLLLEHWAHAAQYLPWLENVGHSGLVTSGFYGEIGDHNPYLGYDPEFRNLLHVTGGCGRGLMMAPFMAHVGRQLASMGMNCDELRLDGRAVDLRPFRPGRIYRPEWVEGAVI